MLSKDGNANNPMNLKPITLTSIIYRKIFGRIAKKFMRFDNREEKTVFCKE
jgi:hypothetical protein